MAADTEPEIKSGIEEERIGMADMFSRLMEGKEAIDEEKKKELEESRKKTLEKIEEEKRKEERRKERELGYIPPLYDETGWGAYIVEFATDMFCAVCDDKIVYMNYGGIKMLKFHNPEEVIGKNFRSLFPKEERLKLDENMNLLLEEYEKPLRIEMTNARGLPQPVELRARMIENPDAETFIIEARDITSIITAEKQQEKAKKSMSHSSSTDSLTGLPKGRFFNGQIDKAIARTIRKARGNMENATDLLAVIVLEIKNIGDIRKSFGEKAGEHILKSIGTRLAGAFRQEDMIGRGDGDQFLIVLETIHGLDDVDVVSRKSLGLISDPVAYQGSDIELVCSLGIALFPQNGKHTLTLLRSAQKAVIDAPDGHYLVLPGQ